MERLKDKVAIITGGAGGIGKATAKRFLEEGAKVLLVDLKDQELQRALEELKNKNLAIYRADVSRSEEVRAYTEACLGKFGQIDLFFNNAGIEGKFLSISQYPEEIFDKVIAVNLKGVWLGCQHVIPRMQEGGSVIITSSVAGLKGFSNLGPYVASKHAVVGIMRVAAIEFADKKIRVNSIHPGPVNNRMIRSIEEQISPEDPENAKEGFENSTLLHRYAENEEIAELALFLASDQSSYITGTTQVIDGGMCLA
jgi:NAD(P)-dependent dehydrogenase (short-subunit alcohol dehydrogenase family)